MGLSVRNLREFSLRECQFQELSPRFPSQQETRHPITATLCQPVLTVPVSTHSLTLLTLPMHNSLLNHKFLSSLLHLLSDNLLLLLSLNNNPSNLNNPSSLNNLSNLNNHSSNHNKHFNLNKPSNPNSNKPSSLPSFSNLPSLYSRLPSDNPGSKLPHNRRGSSTLTDSKAGSTLISLLRLYL